MNKTKICDRCKKEKVIWKNKVIEGVKMKLCQQCTNIVEREQIKEKKRVKREKKKESIPYLTKELDRVFSLFIRKRDSNSEGIGKCITCDNTGHYKDFDCGHFRSRKYMSTRWDECNCNLQCKTCNLYNNGEEYIHGLKIDEKYGKGTALKLLEKSKQTVKLDRETLKHFISWYQAKLNGDISGIY